MRGKNLKEFLSYANLNITSEHDKLLAPNFLAVHRQGSRGEYGLEGGVGAGRQEEEIWMSECQE